MKEQYGDNETIQIDIRDTLSVIKQCDDEEQQLVLSLQRLEDESRQNSFAEQDNVLVGETENPLKQRLMASEKIIQLLNILNKIRVKLQTIMTETMSVMERSNEIENLVDTITELKEGTWCYLPLACLTNLFEGLWRRITTAHQEILDQS